MATNSGLHSQPLGAASRLQLGCNPFVAIGDQLEVCYHAGISFDPPRGFHKSHGRNVTLISSNIARRSNPQVPGGAYVFTQVPIKLEDVVVLQITEVARQFEKQALMFGFTNRDPLRMDPASLPDDHTELTREGYWRVWECESLPPRTGEEIGLYYDAEGSVYVYRNNKSPLKAGNITLNQQLYVVLDLYGSTIGVRLIGITTLRAVRSIWSGENASVPAAVVPGQQPRIAQHRQPQVAGLSSVVPLRVMLPTSTGAARNGTSSTSRLVVALPPQRPQSAPEPARVPVSANPVSTNDLSTQSLQNVADQLATTTPLQRSVNNSNNSHAPSQLSATARQLRVRIPTNVSTTTAASTPQSQSLPVSNAQAPPPMHLVTASGSTAQLRVQLPPRTQTSVPNCSTSSRNAAALSLNARQTQPTARGLSAGFSGATTATQQQSRAASASATAATGRRPPTSVPRPTVTTAAATQVPMLLGHPHQTAITVPSTSAATTYQSRKFTSSQRGPAILAAPSTIAAVSQADAVQLTDNTLPSRSTQPNMDAILSALRANTLYARQQQDQFHQGTLLQPHNAVPITGSNSLIVDNQSNMNMMMSGINHQRMVATLRDLTIAGTSDTNVWDVNIGANSSGAVVSADSSAMAMSRRSASPISTIARDSECSICMAAEKNCAFYRCGHVCACYECAVAEKNSSGICPMCRAPILDVLRTYHS